MLKDSPTRVVKCPQKGLTAEPLGVMWQAHGAMTAVMSMLKEVELQTRPCAPLQLQSSAIQHRLLAGFRITEMGLNSRTAIPAAHVPLLELSIR